MNPRQLTFLDHLIAHVDNGMRTLFGENHASRPNPADVHAEKKLSSAEKELAGRLMRINHAGEVAAQGLYQGQALTAKLPDVSEQMDAAAQEEVDHLAWCKTRTEELGAHTSLLDPVWYIGSAAIGAVAGLAGDKWSLGFVTETERQVVKHLERHLEQLPQHDEKSRAILEQMKTDEQHHATTALEAGAAELPAPIKKAMTLASKVMTKTAYWI
ncbi:MAG: 2-polyprenyl-3-methyl-6-methoxy-1,4-benzoquinone monooxygenase [Gammaproteobacteria bacterium]|nr:2-polyprenyl-3-methyl-6-methoxy-1,4-benzoquinone monooxygenase [Gammaproteobacteria bacterium]